MVARFFFIASTQMQWNVYHQINPVTVSKQKDGEDTHVPNVEPRATLQHPSFNKVAHWWGPKRWNFTATAAFAVPYWKVFLFGGNSGDLDQNRPQGYHRNDIQVMECIESSENEEYPALKWDHPITLGDIPSPRSDTEMFYSESSGKLFLFGGWSNTWHNEVYTCEISSGVGPPYNIFSMKSTEWNTSQGPLTGGSKMILN